MRAKLSVVIPTLNAAGDLPGSLVCLMEGVEAGLLREVVVSDGGSDDATATLADRAGALVVAGAPGRGGQMARGAFAAQGEWLLFLHADTHLAPGWSTAVTDHMTQRGACAGYFRLQFRAAGFGPGWVARWANLRARLFGLPYGDQGLLISSSLYEQVGGFQDIALMEDVAMARALGGRLLPIDSVAATGAARFQRGGWFRGGARNIATLLRYLAGADPDKLARGYARR